jgi:hypothetical protein
MMDRIEFPEGEEPEVQTVISPECQRDECDQCPGFQDLDGKPMFCIHDCHRIPPSELPPDLRSSPLTEI